MISSKTPYRKFDPKIIFFLSYTGKGKGEKMSQCHIGATCYRATFVKDS